MKQFIYRINGQDYIVAVNKLEGSVAEVAVNGSNYAVELVNNDEEINVASRPAAKAAAAPAAKKAVTASAPAPAAGGAGSIKSPLPGIVVSISVNVGDTVKKGQTVAVLEAMKMENALPAHMDGKVAAINVNEGDSILEGVTILTLE